MRIIGTASLIAILLALSLWSGEAQAQARYWQAEWPNTDFETSSVDLGEIISGGPPKDGIPSIDDPRFLPVAEEEGLSPQEPVISLVVNGDARAYPLRIMTWHEIANDVVGGVPVVITYCPLCNSALAYKRTVEGEVLEFGTTGKLRNSDLVMYDRSTESWWQQFLGEAIVGEMTGTRLELLPARLEAWERFKARHPEGRVLVPRNRHARPYGRNPYVGYDSSSRPFLYRGELPSDIEPMAYVVAVEDQAWPLGKLREAGRIESGDLVITWEEGASSALDTQEIAEGRDIGNVVVRRDSGSGPEDVPYDLTFAFVFHAFRPDGTIHR